MRGTVNEIAWAEEGDPAAPPILLIRPLGGNMALWGAFATTLARELRVVMFDARGTGLSRGLPRTRTRALADDAARVLEARRIDRADVFGISLGGMVATRFVLTYPDRVRSLVLASTASRGVSFERAGIGRALAFSRCLLLPDAEAERGIVMRVLSRHFRDEHPEEAARVADLAARNPSPRSSIVAHALAALRHDARAEIARITCPTLILAGERDHLLGPHTGESLTRYIPHATRTIIAGSGHDLTLERPRETAERVLELQRRSTAA